MLAGITDYVLGGIYYQQQESHYVVVTPPTQVIQVQTDASLIPLVVVGAGRALYIEVPQPCAEPAKKMGAAAPVLRSG